MRVEKFLRLYGIYEVLPLASPTLPKAFATLLYLISCRDNACFFVSEAAGCSILGLSPYAYVERVKRNLLGALSSPGFD